MATLSKVDDIYRGRRFLWSLVFFCLYRPSPILAFKWRVLLLRLFGGDVDYAAFPYPSARIWAPWNLIMKKGSCIGPSSEIYNVATITLGFEALVSQRAYLCTASHDYEEQSFALVASPIELDACSWVAAEAFVGPGVRIGEKAVILARAVVSKNVPSLAVMAGNPAKQVKTRCIVK